MAATIDPADLIPLDVFEDDFPLSIDLVYAQADHPENIFETAIYRPDARMWAHRDMARIILLAATLCHDAHGYRFVLKDCLRTTDAQAAMQETDIVNANPHWCQEPNRLLSPPGKGAHPRGMAIDVILRDSGGQDINMGTPFDYLTRDPSDNPARRDYPAFGDDIQKNRKILENAFLDAAMKLDTEILPLPAEWWDFRFPLDVISNYAPLSDAGLPLQMRMTERCQQPAIRDDFPSHHFDTLKDEIIGSLPLHPVKI